MRFLALILSCLCLGAHATPTTDFSDLWFNPGEAGWGATLTQQDQIIFITFFVYDTNGNPKWYVGPSTVFAGATSAGVVTFSGPLYEAKGPYFGAATFDPNQLVVTPVGQVTFMAGQIGAATLAYNVGGVSVTKSIVRQTWSYENVGGVYVGASLGRRSGCGAQDGYFESAATVTVAHDGGNAVTVKEEGSGYTCNYLGTYTQLGRMGQINGVGSCTNGTVQSFVATEVQGGVQGLTMRYSATLSGACTVNGRMGGIRRGS